MDIPFKDIWELIERNIPAPVVSWVGLLLAILFLLFCSLWLISGITNLIKKIRPIFYNDAEKRRNRQRQRFATHIVNEIERINNKEEWNDYRFAELEAEVETEGNRRGNSFFPFIKRGQTGLRKEKSLSNVTVVQSSQET